MNFRHGIVFIVTFLAMIPMDALACKIMVKTHEGDAGRSVMIGIDQGVTEADRCTKQYFADFYNSLHDEADKDFYRSLLKRFFTEGSRGSWTAYWSTTGGVETVQHENFTAVRIDRQPAGERSRVPAPPRVSGPSFEDIYGTEFDPRKLSGPVEFAFHDLPAPAAPDSGLNADDMAKLTMAGFTISKIMSSGVLREVGQSFEVVWNSLVFQQEIPDYVAAADRAALIGKALRDLADFRRRALSAYQQTLKSTQQLRFYNDLKIVESTGNMRDTSAAIQAAVREIKSHEEVLAEAAASLTTLASKAMAEARVPNEELATLRAGQLPREAILALESKFSAEIDNFSKQRSLANLTSLSQMANAERNPLRREQYKQILAGALDDQGLVSQWRSLQPMVSRASLRTLSTSSSGAAIRANLNEALGWLATVPETMTDQDRRAQLEFATKVLLDADRAIADGDEVVGLRRLNRARRLLDFATSNPRAAQLRAYRVNETARKLFGVEADGSTFEGIEIVSVANQLARFEHQIDSDDYLRFHSVTSLKQLSAVRGNLELFDHALDNAWAIVDFSKGVTKGVAQGVYDTATGMWQLVSHPIDSAEAVANAVINYEQTYELISGAIINTYLESENWGPEEYGHFVGRVTYEVGGALIGAGAVTKVAKVAKLRTGIQIAAEVTREPIKRIGKHLLTAGSMTREQLSETLKFINRPLIPGEAGTIRLVRAEKIVDSTKEITSKLTPGRIRNYLSNLDNVPRETLIKDIESVGLKVKGSSPDGRFIEFVDSQGRVRAKIHPSDARTPTSHLHIYDSDGNSLNKVLDVVTRQSPEGHIPIPEV